MKYLLDSDTITAVFDPKSIFFEITKKHLAQLTGEDEIYISILAIYELEFSLCNAKKDIVKNKINNLIADLKSIFNILPLSTEAAAYYGTLKSGFQKSTGINRKAIKKHNIDIMMAATALDYDCILVAKDGIYNDHLALIDKQLDIEDWTIEVNNFTEVIDKSLFEKS